MPLLVSGVPREGPVEHNSVATRDAVALGQGDDHVTTRVRLRQVQPRVRVLPLVTKNKTAEVRVEGMRDDLNDEQTYPSIRNAHGQM